jgi:hypothetical protein
VSGPDGADAALGLDEGWDEEPTDSSTGNQDAAALAAADLAAKEQAVEAAAHALQEAEAAWKTSATPDAMRAKTQAKLALQQARRKAGLATVSTANVEETPPTREGRRTLVARAAVAAVSVGKQKAKPDSEVPGRPPFEKRLVKISDLIRDLQVREKTDPATVEAYAERMSFGDKFPPPVVFEDANGELLPAGGNNTNEAALLNKSEYYECEIRKGDRQEATLFAVSANAKHGLPMNGADKRRAVMMVLNLPGWADKSDAMVAERCGVSDRFVAGVKKDAGIVNSTSLGKDGKIRRKPTKKPAAATPNGSESKSDSTEKPAEQDTQGATPPAPTPNGSELAPAGAHGGTEGEGTPNKDEAERNKADAERPEAKNTAAGAGEPKNGGDNDGQTDDNEAENQYGGEGGERWDEDDEDDEDAEDGDDEDDEDGDGDGDGDGDEDAANNSNTHDDEVEMKKKNDDARAKAKARGQAGARAKAAAKAKKRAAHAASVRAESAGDVTPDDPRVTAVISLSRDYLKALANLLPEVSPLHLAKLARELDLGDPMDACILVYRARIHGELQQIRATCGTLLEGIEDRGEENSLRDQISDLAEEAEEWPKSWIVGATHFQAEVNLLREWLAEILAEVKAAEGGASE